MPRLMQIATPAAPDVPVIRLALFHKSRGSQPSHEQLVLARFNTKIKAFSNQTEPKFNYENKA